jgi:ectoine hydroxylase-related dioxygenase (phytanoyl-CoA dioxygenase family)
VTRENSDKRFHRDILHWSRAAVSVLICPQDIAIENGCLWLIPCSQNFEFFDPSSDPGHGGTWLDEYVFYSDYAAQAVPISMKKGEIVIFDALIFHAPGINQTNEASYTVTAAYHACDELTKSLGHDAKVLVSGERIYRGNELNWSNS